MEHKIIDSKSKAKPTYTNQEKDYHLQQWKNSNLNMSEYCRQSGISPSTLSKWNSSNKFQPVKLNHVSNTAIPLETSLNKNLIEIHLPNGTLIKLTDAKDLHYIVSILG